MEMGYRTKNFYEVMNTAEANFRELMDLPDNYEMFMLDGGATL